MKSVISELTQYNISPDGMDDMITEADESSYLAWKLKDIQVMYQAFEEYLADKYITKEEILDILCNVMDKSRMLKDSVIALDGFTGFTPLQNKVLGEMLHHCQKVMITVTMDKREDPYVMKDKYQLFALSKQMVTSLVRIAVEKRCWSKSRSVCIRSRSGVLEMHRHLHFWRRNCSVTVAGLTGKSSQMCGFMQRQIPGWK